MNESAKRAYWEYKREVQKEKRLTEKLTKAADKVLETEDDELQDAAYKEMRAIQMALDATRKNADILARIVLDTVPEVFFL